jgi:hypothetical protein
VRPRSRGGFTELDNLALACPHCNARKWAHTEGFDSTTGDSIPLFDPRTQVWSDHFRLSSADAVTVEGVTPCGRGTVDRLRMNDPGLLLIRRLLREYDALGNST